jgi:hypothetical protein
VLNHINANSRFSFGLALYEARLIPILSEQPFCDEEVFPSRSIAIIWPSGSGRSDESVSFSQHKRQAIVEFCGSLVEIAWDVDQRVSFVRELLGELRRRRILMPLMRKFTQAQAEGRLWRTNGPCRQHVG